jgi:hypothetical protein
MTRLTRFTGAALVAMLLLPATALAQPSAGTQLRGLLRNSVDSKGAYVGQAVYVDNVASADGSIQGATLRGTVAAVQHAGQGTPGKLQLHFSSLLLQNGRHYYVDGRVTQMNANTKSNALKEAGGAVAGMLVGNAVFKTLFHSSLGGAVGAAGGFLVAKNNKENMTVPAGSVISVYLASVALRQS